MVLDWAGTMIDFGSMAPARAFVRAFEAHGVVVSVEEARGPMGVDKRTHIARMGAEPAIAARWMATHRGAAMTSEDVDHVHAEFVALEMSLVREHAALVPGARELANALRARGLKIGTTSGYSREIMDVVAELARAQGYAPDASICAGETPSGRPGPLQCYEALVALDVWPVAGCIKVDDTLAGIDEGLNAGMWTVAVAVTGNEVGLTREAWEGLGAMAQRALRQRAYDRLLAAGAHYVIDSVAELPSCIEAIEARLRRGETP